MKLLKINLYNAHMRIVANREKSKEQTEEIKMGPKLRQTEIRFEI